MLCQYVLCQYVLVHCIVLSDEVMAKVAICSQCLDHNVQHHLSSLLQHLAGGAILHQWWLPSAQLAQALLDGRNQRVMAQL